MFHPVKVARDYATSVPSSDQSARWSEQQQHGAEVIHGFFPCSRQALPPQVPPRPPERSFHNYSNLSNLKPSYGASSSSLAIARYAVYIILICIYSWTSLEPSWTNAAVTIFDTCLIIRNKWMMQYDYVCRWKSVYAKICLSCIHFGIRGGGNKMDVRDNPLIFSMRVSDFGLVLM